MQDVQAHNVKFTQKHNEGALTGSKVTQWTLAFHLLLRWRPRSFWPACSHARWTPCPAPQLWKGARSGLTSRCTARVAQQELSQSASTPEHNAWKAARRKPIRSSKKSTHKILQMDGRCDTSLGLPRKTQIRIEAAERSKNIEWASRNCPTCLGSRYGRARSA